MAKQKNNLSILLMDNLKRKFILQTSYIILIAFFILNLKSCSKDPCLCTPKGPILELPIRSADLSSLKKVQSFPNTFYNRIGIQKSPVDILIDEGLNTARLRLWHSPSESYSGFESVKEEVQFLKSKGLKIWLSVHYSDSWADPGQQNIPAAWQGLSFSALKDSMLSYTKRIIREMNPDYFQIGNEINSGLLHPLGNISQNESQFLDLLNAASTGIREMNSETKIILHFAGVKGSSWFFEKVKGIDYDYIGLSYYPWWHDVSISELDDSISLLGNQYNREIVIAETAYPFTFGWNDWTNNIVGDSTQLLLPSFPATMDGQQKFLDVLKTTLEYNSHSIGISYWGGELIAFDGPESSTGSPWENCALFDFNNYAVPAIQFLNQ